MKPRHLVAIATLASTSLTSGFDNNLHKFVRPQQRRPVVSRLAVVLRLTTNEDDSPRSYADDVFFRGNMNERGDFRPAESSGFSVPTFKWDTSEFRTLIIVIAFTAYPRIKDVFSALPPPNETEGGYFFSLVSIVFGTLTAATVSQAADRLDKLRAAAVREVTLFLPLVKRLEVELSSTYGNTGQLNADKSLMAATTAAVVASASDDSEMAAVSADERHSVLVALLRHLWAYTGILINGSRADELRAIAEGNDELILFIEVAASAQRDWSQRAGGVDLGFALEAANRAVAERGARLSLENAGIPAPQFSALRVLSVALLGAYAYLTLCRDGGYTAASTATTGGILLGSPYMSSLLAVVPSDIGVRSLFSIISGTLVLFFNLASDLNTPFNGKNTIRSGTVTASLLQLRRTMASVLGYSMDEGL